MTEKELKRRFEEDWFDVVDEEDRPVLPEWFRVRGIYLNGVRILKLQAMELNNIKADSFGIVPNEDFDTTLYYVTKQYYHLTREGITPVSKAMAFELIKAGEETDEGDD